MGCYVNPKDEPKEVWLMENREGDIIEMMHLEFVKIASKKDPYEVICEDNCLPVVLINNGPFTAAGIAYNKNEWDTFTNTKNDTRPRVIFKVKIEKLKEVSDLSEYLRD